MHFHQLSFLCMLQRPPTSPLFPYTTLFRSHTAQSRGDRIRMCAFGFGHIPAGREHVFTRAHIEPGACMLGTRDAPCLVRDRKSTRLNSSHVRISYAVFCLKKKTTTHDT